MKAIAVISSVLGGLILLTGLLFKALQWPDMFMGTITGPILIAIGVVFFVIEKMKKR